MVSNSGNRLKDEVADGVIMEFKMNVNAVNQFPEGSTIYTEGDPVFNIAMIIKGRVMIHNDGARIIMGSGAFIGVQDLYSGRFYSTYTACDDVMIYVFPVSTTEELENVLNINKDYHGFMVASFNKIIYDLNQIYKGIHKLGLELHRFLTGTYQEYLALSARRGYKVKTSQRIADLEALDHEELFSLELSLINDRINYYCECKNLPMEAVKQFYSYGNTITLLQVEDQVNIVNLQVETMKEMSSTFVSMAECLMDDSDSCLFSLIAGLSVEMDNVTGGSSDLLNVMDDTIEILNRVEIFAEKMLDKKFKVNRKRMEEIYHLLLTGNRGADVSAEVLMKYSKEDMESALLELQDSYQKLLDYGGVTGDRATEMKAALQDFIGLKDKSSIDDSSRVVRRHLAENHYELYKPVFLRAYQDKQVPRLVDIFLKYGYVDENLLTKDQLLEIYFLQDQEQQGECKVYDIKSWLVQIFEGKKEPSKNEFDLEYPEALSTLRKQGKLTDKEVHLHMSNAEKKLEYEIQNMFRYNNRTTNGQITSFIPVLHKELWSNNLERLFITPTRVNEAIDKILNIDYSVFDREVIYSNKEKNIVKEYIIKRVWPDIILMPNVGSNGVMWQEINGKRRDSSGRFLLPVFTDMNIQGILTKVFGRFRWELCRTIEGSAWNDIKHKSLTSEYSDYLQFYRKNKELSEEKKEKVKNQIQKGRNNSREIFVLDYEQWINYESKGALKLNKPVREMMATYCPFSKKIREQLKNQPLFEEAMGRYHREKLKKVRELEGRQRLLQKDQIEITQELIDTLNYHRDM